MPRRVFLHVGSPKTGTTFLQQVLWSHRELLQRQGVLLPLGSVQDHFRASLDVRGDVAYVSDPARIPGTWAALVAEASSWDGDVLVSHELFAPATAEQARRAVAALPDGVEIHVVLTARDLVRQIPAHWQQNVKVRSAQPFGEFLDEIRADANRTSWFWQVQDFAAVLERWGGHLPRDRVHVVTLPPSGAPVDLLWRRFASVLGIDPEPFDLGRVRSNASLGAEQTELLRRLNGVLGERLPRPGPYAGTVKGLFSNRLLSAQRGSRLALAGDDLEFARRESERVAAELERSGVHVVGDLGDLRPARPESDAGARPAREVPADSDVLAAALEVLVSVLEHVDGREEEHRARVARLRQRLRTR